MITPQQSVAAATGRLRDEVVGQRVMTIATVGIEHRHRTAESHADVVVQPSIAVRVRSGWADHRQALCSAPSGL
jgi:hypothetical protein